ncbi:MAG: antibiotic biosynthesis monooxygenase [Nocardioides sp.]|nr:antibiotic biosynthesis monooxygenase [Nocardioides sp.]
MTVIATLELRLRPDSLDEARTILRRVLAETRAFDGCEGVDVMVDETDPAHVVAVERWRDMEADSAYRAFRAGPGKITDFATILAGAPVLTRGEVADL